MLACHAAEATSSFLDELSLRQLSTDVLPVRSPRFLQILPSFYVVMVFDLLGFITAVWHCAICQLWYVLQFAHWLQLAHVSMVFAASLHVLKRFVTM